jgi:ribosomal protein L13
MKAQGQGALIDEVGHIYGRLEVRSRAAKRSTGKHKHVMWWCLCECGDRVVVDGANLRNGKTRSCGATNCRALL